MIKSTKMSLDEHKMNADDLAIAFHHLSKILDRCNEYHPQSSKLMKLLSKVCPVSSKPFSDIRCLLDAEFHSIINDDEFRELGHIYYNLQERYKQNNEKELSK
jgi:hypothetical protein